jgi:hypothetical protein
MHIDGGTTPERILGEKTEAFSECDLHRSRQLEELAFRRSFRPDPEGQL